MANMLSISRREFFTRVGQGAALAATGIGSFTNYLAISFIIGLSAGVGPPMVTWLPMTTPG